MIAATIACALACAGLVAAEALGARTARVACKLAASAAFVAVALLAGAGGPRDGYTTWITIGLGFGAIGDALLLGSRDRAFVLGLGAFLVGHVTYVVGIAQRVPVHAWLDRAGVWAIAPIAVGALALVRLWPKLGALRAPVIAYVATIVAMMIGALAARDDGRLCAGAALFFISDLAVARDKFVVAELANKLWGLPAYYAGQLLIAWSLAS